MGEYPSLRGRYYCYCRHHCYYYYYDYNYDYYCYYYYDYYSLLQLAPAEASQAAGQMDVDSILSLDAKSMDEIKLMVLELNSQLITLQEKVQKGEFARSRVVKQRDYWQSEALAARSEVSRLQELAIAARWKPGRYFTQRGGLVAGIRRNTGANVGVGAFASILDLDAAESSIVAWEHKAQVC